MTPAEEELAVELLSGSKTVAELEELDQYGSEAPALAALLEQNLVVLSDERYSITKQGRSVLYKARGWELDGKPWWYQEARQEVREFAEHGEKRILATERSQSSRYTLHVYKVTKSAEDPVYTEGVISGGVREVVVQRNHPTFPFAWVESHPNGHDYLICGEDYHGITVIELTTERRVDYAPDRLPERAIFCAVDFYVAPSGDVLVIDGCVMAAPYELVAVDLAFPMQLPYPELHRSPVDDVEGSGFVNGIIKWSFSREVRAVDGVPLDELGDDEVDALAVADEGSNIKVVQYQCAWRPGTEVDCKVVENGS